MVMGPEGSTVTLEVLRDGSTVLMVEVGREWTRSMERAAPLGQKSGEFDPSEFAGSDSEGSDQTRTAASSRGRVCGVPESAVCCLCVVDACVAVRDQECGVGLSVGKDERGRYHVTEVVLGGAADSTGAVRVGDMMEGIDDEMLSVEMNHAAVMGLLRGPARTSVTLHMVRDGKPYS
eukprot:2452435-Rhodomonas_salina.1